MDNNTDRTAMKVYEDRSKWLKALMSFLKNAHCCFLTALTDWYFNTFTMSQEIIFLVIIARNASFKTVRTFHLIAL